MASVLYPKGKEGLIDGSIDMDTNDIRIILIDTADYTYNAAHDNLDDVAAGSRVATSGALSSKTVTNGTFDSADVTLSAVSGDPSEAIIMYKHTGTESTSRLIGYWDSGTGLPVTPNGGDITITVHASGWFSL